MNLTPSGTHHALREKVTDAYIIIMFLIFPLFPGFSGYSSITISKFIFFMAATGVWLLMLLASAIWEGSLRRVPTLPQFAALLYLLVCALSLVLSPNLVSAFLGAGRYDGFLTTAACIFIFLGVSSCTRVKPRFVYCLALSVSLCALISLFQLAGFNPLKLYPADLNFYDAGLRYSGTFLGTIGNTNIYDSLLCLALPLFAAQFICGTSSFVLIPLLLSIPVLVKAGGDGGKLALFVTALLSLPLLLTEFSRVRSALRCAAYILLAVALSLCWQPAGGKGFAFVDSAAALAMAIAAVLLFIIAILPLPKTFTPDRKHIRIATLALVGVILLLCLLAMLTADSGTLFELRQLLLGNAEDHFGSSRIGIWRACLALVPERPLLGSGPGTLALRLNIEFSRYVPETGITLRSFVDNAHNVYLATLVNTGILGLLSLLFFLFCCGKSSLCRHSSPLQRSFALGAVCCAVQEFFGLGLCLTTPIFWIYLAFICSNCSNSHISSEDIACQKKVN